MATLKELRTLCGMTQKELAEKSGVNIRQIQKYESGEYSLDNMTAKTADAISHALGCSIDELVNMNTSIFTSEMTEAIKSGEMTLSDALEMDKYQKVIKISKIGCFGDTFRANYRRIPESLIDKLTAEETAELVDAFYQCYSDGKNAQKKEHKAPLSNAL